MQHCLLQGKPQWPPGNVMLLLLQHMLQRRTCQQQLHAAVEEACVAEVGETNNGLLGGIQVLCCVSSTDQLIVRDLLRQQQTSRATNKLDHMSSEL